jgi:hypothetical protein
MKDAQIILQNDGKNHGTEQKKNNKNFKNKKII